jgi:hypothetical protein
MRPGVSRVGRQWHALHADGENDGLISLPPSLPCRAAAQQGVPPLPLTFFQPVRAELRRDTHDHSKANKKPQSAPAPGFGRDARNNRRDAGATPRIFRRLSADDRPETVPPHLYAGVITPLRVSSTIYYGRA